MGLLFKITTFFLAVHVSAHAQFLDLDEEGVIRVNGQVAVFNFQEASGYDYKARKKTKPDICEKSFRGYRMSTALETVKWLNDYFSVWSGSGTPPQGYKVYPGLINTDGTKDKFSFDRRFNASKPDWAQNDIELWTASVLAFMPDYAFYIDYYQNLVFGKGRRYNRAVHCTRNPQ